MKITSSVLALFVLTYQVVASPVPYGKQSNDKQRVLYDQRQQGELNVRADLKNFVVLIIPKTPVSQDSGSSLLDLFTRQHSHHLKHMKNANNDAVSETMHFIESKTAPYHVDITKSSSHLMNDEILATQTPPVALDLKVTEDKPKGAPIEASVIRQLRSIKFPKAFVLTVPEEEFVLTRTEDNKKVVKKDGIKKKINKKTNKEEMTLLGAIEQCGPDMIRDAEGICRLKSNESIEREE